MAYGTGVPIDWSSTIVKSVEIEAFAQAYCRSMLDEIYADEEKLIKTLLGYWISELEPEIFKGPHFTIVGLGYAGRLLVELDPDFYLTAPHRRASYVDRRPQNT